MNEEMLNKNVFKIFSFIFVFESVLFMACDSIANTVISLVAHKLREIYITNQNSRLEHMS